MTDPNTVLAAAIALVGAGMIVLLYGMHRRPAGFAGFITGTATVGMGIVALATNLPA